MYVEVELSAPVDCVPAEVLSPVHAPDAVHAAEFVADHVSVELCPLVSVVGEADKVIAGGAEDPKVVAVKLVQPNCSLPFGIPLV